MRHERADTVPFGSGFARGAATEGAVPSRSSILVRVHGPLLSIHRRQGADVLAHVFQNSAAVVRSGVRACVLQNGQALVRPRRRLPMARSRGEPYTETGAEISLAVVTQTRDTRHLVRRASATGSMQFRETSQPRSWPANSFTL